MMNLARDIPTKKRPPVGIDLTGDRFHALQLYGAFSGPLSVYCHFIDLCGIRSGYRDNADTRGKTVDHGIPGAASGTSADTGKIIGSELQILFSGDYDRITIYSDLYCVI